MLTSLYRHVVDMYYTYMYIQTPTKATQAPRQRSRSQLLPNRGYGIAKTALPIQPPLVCVALLSKYCFWLLYSLLVAVQSQPRRSRPLPNAQHFTSLYRRVIDMYYTYMYIQTPTKATQAPRQRFRSQLLPTEATGSLRLRSRSSPLLSVLLCSVNIVSGCCTVCW